MNSSRLDLVRTELLRAVRRVAPDRAVHARTVLETLTLVEVTAQFNGVPVLAPA